MKIYPRAAEPVEDVEGDPISEAEMVRRVVEAREDGQVTVDGVVHRIAGESRGACTGACLRLPDDASDPKNPGRGSDQVGLFNRIWGEIDAEAKAMAAINPVDHKDLESYLAALDDAATHLVARLYCDGVLAKAGATDFPALKASLAA